MKNLYILFTYNRTMILNECIKTLLANNVLRPNRFIIIDNGSETTLKHSLFSLQVNIPNIDIDLVSLKKNISYGGAAELAFKFAEAYNPEYLYLIESDYIFAPNGLDIIAELFEKNEFAKEAIAFSGYDNPDFYVPQKINVDYHNILMEQFGEDNINRSILYKPFEQETSFGKIQLELVSNSCSTTYWNWKKVMEIKKEFPDEYAKWVYLTIDKDKPVRYLNDGALSGGISWLWNKHAIKHGIDRNKYAAMLNVKPSVANHINGGKSSISGHIIEEGQTFVGSPSWKVS